MPAAAAAAPLARRSVPRSLPREVWLPPAWLLSPLRLKELTELLPRSRTLAWLAAAPIALLPLSRLPKLALLAALLAALAVWLRWFSRFGVWPNALPRWSPPSRALSDPATELADAPIAGVLSRLIAVDWLAEMLATRSLLPPRMDREAPSSDWAGCTPVAFAMRPQPMPWLRNWSTPGISVDCPWAFVTVPPINAASVCSGVGLVIPAAARLRFANVIARSTSPFPICPVGGVNVAVSPEPVSVTGLPLRKPSRRLVELSLLVVPLAVPPLVAVVVVVAVLMLLLLPFTILLLSPTMLLLPVIVVPAGRKISISLIAVALALLVLVLLELALGAVEPVVV